MIRTYNLTIHIIRLRRFSRVEYQKISTATLSHPIRHDVSLSETKTNNTPSYFGQVKMLSVAYRVLCLFLFLRVFDSKDAAKTYNSTWHERSLYLRKAAWKRGPITGVFSREAKCLSTRERMTWTDVGLNWRNDHNRGPTQRVCDLFFLARALRQRIREI